jgi:xanthine dehydrogenase accessory factor
MRSIYPSILEQIRNGSRCVLATVVSTSGSTPQKPGSSALFGKEGLLAGTVGGGLLEGEVQHLAANILISETSDLVYFNLDSDEGEEGAICGGEANVLVDANPATHMKALVAMEKSLAMRKQGFLLTVVNKKLEQGRFIARYWLEGNVDEELAPELDPSVKDVIPGHLKQAIRYGFTEVVFQPTGRDATEMAYLEHMKPMPRLLIAGAGHVGRALAHLGALLEFEVTVVDDRQEFANPVNIPDANHLVVKEVGAAMIELEKGPDTYIVIVTRGHQYDAEALKPCIGFNVAYIGMIGSTHKVAVMKKQFLENQWVTPEQWSDIHTPIGIAIGSKTVEEIAISIAAQLVEVRNRKIASHAE